jgi:RES domain-containing protein
MTPADLAANDWRIRMGNDGKAPTQILAESLIAAGYAGLRVRSFAAGASAEDLNMVLWVWGNDLPAKLVLIDDEGRLLQ